MCQRRKTETGSVPFCVAPLWNVTTTARRPQPTAHRELGRALPPNRYCPPRLSVDVRVALPFRPAQRANGIFHSFQQIVENLPQFVHCAQKSTSKSFKGVI